MGGSSIVEDREGIRGLEGPSHLNVRGAVLSKKQRKGRRKHPNNYTIKSTQMKHTLFP